MHRLTDLIDRLRAAGLLATRFRLEADQQDIANLSIDHLAFDSRAVGPGGLFVAMSGTAHDGHLFIDKAVNNGAVAIACEAVPDGARERFPGTVFVRVRDGRQALAALAAAFYDDPADALRLVGVTGTNGKTTVTHLLHHVLMALAEPTGLIGTIANRIGNEPVPSRLTTPDPVEIHRLLRQMADAGCTACVMEVSSHALDQERVYGIPFDVGVFTNFTRDHLDYHETTAAYEAAKKKLFDGLAASATAVYNRDDEAGPRMVAGTAAAQVAYGERDGADVPFTVTANRLDGLWLVLDGHPVQLQLVGRFNAYNAAAAYAAARALGHEPEAVRAALATAPPVPGRFEQLRFPTVSQATGAEGTVTVIVDYAHTPDALQNVLETIVELMPDAGTLWCVFGCGGDRDPTKRRVMGSIAERFADRVIVTSDNPRTEDPEAIMNDIRRGMTQPREALWIVDRRAAVARATHEAAPGDVVLIAGKGHEPYQVLGTETIPFDDREVARRSFGG